MKKMNKRELLRKTGNLSQLCGVREVRCTSGKAEGLRLLQVYNAAGLSFTVVPDKCLDIYDFSFCGVNFAFHTKNGLTGNQWYSPVNMEFMNYWSAGMLCTCGLENAGPSCELPDGMVLPLHGRLSMTPAENLCVRQEWREDDYVIEIEGQMRETRLEGHNLLFTRKISLSLFSNTVRIQDRLENEGFSPFDFMLLYHINFGYPVIDEGTKILMESGKPVWGRTTYAEERKQNCHVMEPVCDEVEEEVFFHDIPPGKDGFSRVSVVNEKLRMGAEILYSYETLPVLSQWKFCAPGEYVLGIEPGNSHIEGRAEGSKNHALASIGAGESLEFSVVMKPFKLQ